MMRREGEGLKNQTKSWGRREEGEERESELNVEIERERDREIWKRRKKKEYNK